jgi:hypothetical protein
VVHDLILILLELITFLRIGVGRDSPPHLLSIDRSEDNDVDVGWDDCQLLNNLPPFITNGKEYKYGSASGLLHALCLPLIRFRTILRNVNSGIPLRNAS